jgi:hypothetical protein
VPMELARCACRSRASRTRGSPAVCAAGRRRGRRGSPAVRAAVGRRGCQRCGLPQPRAVPVTRCRVSSGCSVRRAALLRAVAKGGASVTLLRGQDDVSTKGIQRC